MLVPVTVIRVNGVPQWEGGVGPGRQAECSRCGRCKLVADDGKTPGRAAKHAIAELARTCEGQGMHHYYRSRLPAGVSLLYRFGGEWRPANWVGNRVCNAAGECGPAVPVKVVARDAKAVRHAERLAERIRRTWADVRVERPAVAEGAKA